MEHKPPGAGKSSYDLVDADAVFKRLSLRADAAFLDIACGVGKYTLKAAELVGKHGSIAVGLPRLTLSFFSASVI